MALTGELHEAIKSKARIASRAPVTLDQRLRVTTEWVRDLPTRSHHAGRTAMLGLSPWMLLSPDWAVQWVSLDDPLPGRTMSTLGCDCLVRSGGFFRSLVGGFRALMVPTSEVRIRLGWLPFSR
jgi:hypothetical protein